MTTTQSSSGPLAIAKMAIGIWSTSERQRPPPTDKKTKHIRLITIAASHYCEKVRWVLDMLEADDLNPYYYTEDAHPPGLHSYEPLQVSKEQASITPMVAYNDNANATEDTVLWESSKIVNTFMPSLYPEEIADQIKEMEAEIGRRLGPAVRCTAYYSLFTDLKKYQATAESMAADPRKMSNIEATLWGKFLPKGLAKGMWKAMNINEETNEACTKDMHALFDQMSKRLSNNGGKYLMDLPGGKTSYGFTAADLTLAALAYPLLRPPQMQFWLADTDRLPPELNKISEELRATTAGQHVLRIYEKHRPTGKDGIAEMKGADRNRTFWQWLFGSG
jgi:glutathione S-transferase